MKSESNFQELELAPRKNIISPATTNSQKIEKILIVKILATSPPPPTRKAKSVNIYASMYKTEHNLV